MHVIANIKEFSDRLTRVRTESYKPGKNSIAELDDALERMMEA